MKSILQICFVLGLMPFFSSFTRSTEASEQAVPITATVATYINCRTGTNCTAWSSSSFKRWHGIKITFDQATLNYYTAGFDFKIYPANVTSGTPLAKFTCVKGYVEFVSSILANSTTYNLVIEDVGSGTKGVYSFTTGTGAGTSCVNNIVLPESNQIPIKKN